jgi:hypothetical protein
VSAFALPVDFDSATGPSNPTRLSVATNNARSAAAAASALAALSAAAAATAQPAPPAVREFVDELAGMLPVRLTVHQRETLESSLARAIGAVVVQHRAKA